MLKGSILHSPRGTIWAEEGAATPSPAQAANAVKTLPRWCIAQNII